MLAAVEQVNDRQKLVLFEKVRQHFGDQMTGRRFALWGLSFKPRTDDIREAPALVLIDRLLAAGATLRVHDPEAIDNVERCYGRRLEYARVPYDALDGADALLIATEWKEFVQPDFQLMRSRMRTPLVFDGRNLYNPETLKQAGFTYHSIGRMTVTQPAK